MTETTVTMTNENVVSDFRQLGSAHRSPSSSSCNSLSDMQSKSQPNNNGGGGGAERCRLDCYEPGPNDVICARGKASFNHEGNKRFRAILEKEMESYSMARCKLEKSLFLSKIVSQVRSLGGRFVRKQENGGGAWEDVGDYSAREKVGQGFRDLLDTKYRSSTKAKRRKRTKYMQDVLEKRSSQPHPGDGSSNQHEATENTGRPHTPSGSSTGGMSASSLFDNNNSSLAVTDEEMFMERVFQQANMELLKRIKQDDPGLSSSSLSSSSVSSDGQQSCAISPGPTMEQSCRASAQFLQDYISHFFPNGFS